MLPSRTTHARVSAPLKADPFSFAGEMAPLLRSHHWHNSPLGQPEFWPSELRMALAMCLQARFPMAILWGRDLTLLYNDGWRYMAGGLHPWCLGQPAHEVWAQHWAHVAPQVKAVMQGGQLAQPLLLPLTAHSGGEARHVSLSPVTDGMGRVAGFFATPAEFSAIQPAPQELHRQEEARNAFLAHMSHEIRTPMNAVVGLSNLLAMDRKLSGKQKEMACTLQENAQSVLQLVNDLLDLARMEMNGLQVECVPFTFNEVISQIFIGLSVKAQEKGITLDYAPAALGAQSYMGDPLRIKQVASSLVSAAINASPRGLITISLEADEVQPSGQVALRLSVTSSAISTAQQQLEWMFETMGYKALGKYTSEELALSICRQLASRMGARITARRSAETGAVLTVHMPLVSAGRPAPQGQPAMHGRVLLVEDYKPNVIVAAHMLESLGYTCEVASNGREALDKIREGRDYYTAVLMDVLMPGMDGLEATRQLRNEETRRGLPRLPVIAVTAYALHGDRERCLAAGMDAYMAKPFQPAELEIRLNELQPKIPE